MRRSLLLSILLPLLVISGCREDKSPVIPPIPLSPEEQTIANCYTVQQAAEAFAVQNGGLYPQTVQSDTTLAGDTLKDFLPQGVLLENPFTQARSEPTWGLAQAPGRTGYQPSGVPSYGYIITGHGAEGVIIQLFKQP